MRTFSYPQPGSRRVEKEASITHDEPRSAFLLTRKRAAIGLIPISHPSNIAVIFDHQIAIGMQIKTKTPAR